MADSTLASTLFSPLLIHNCFRSVGWLFLALGNFYKYKMSIIFLKIIMQAVITDPPTVLQTFIFLCHLWEKLFLSQMGLFVAVLQVDTGTDWWKVWLAGWYPALLIHLCVSPQQGHIMVHTIFRACPHRYFTNQIMLMSFGTSKLTPHWEQ